MLKERERGCRAVEKYNEVLGYLPEGMAREIREIARSVAGFEYRICEIRLRADGPSSLVMGAVWYPLFYRVSVREMADLLLLLTEGAAYAHRSTIARGYISVGGIRVGVSGYARYDGDEVGVGEVRSLVFRLGGTYCSFGEGMYRDWCERGKPNLLVAAPPMGGKTTALRSLAGYIGSGRAAERVAVVDERCEFDPGEYRSATVDVLRGYRRAEGIELAYRTMAAEVIIADEIASFAEAEALLAAHGAGVRLISSVHAASAEDIKERRCLSPLLAAGVFGMAAVIKNEGRSYGYELSEIVG